ncbi:MAG: hypothetical protein LIO65_09140 [Odoribacter sp.]|nr:hypothetical protein [Odoribacter sp.]
MIPTPEFSEKLDALEKEFKKYLKCQDLLEMIRINQSGERNELVENAPESARKAHDEYYRLCESMPNWKEKRK